MAGPAVNLGSLVVDLRADTLGFTKAMAGVERTVNAASEKLTSLGTKLSIALTAPIVGFAYKSVRAFVDFDQAMTQSMAIMGEISEATRTELEATAKTIAINTTTSATDLAKAYYFLASAGLDAQQSMKALAAVEQFATAGLMDMEHATTYAMDAQSALGLKVKDATQNLTNLIRVTDVLSKANILANANIEEFSKALTTKSAAALRNLNKDVEEGVAVLAAFADQGIKGEIAGEKLSIVLRDLQTSVLKENKAWAQMGMSIYDVNGKMLPIADIIAQLETKFGSMTDKQQKATAEMLGFQDRSFSAIQTLMGTSAKIREYEEALRKAGGTTREIAEKQMTSFAGQMKILWNNIVDVSMEIGKALIPAIQKVTAWIQQALNWWRGLNNSSKESIMLFAGIAAAVGPALLILGKVIGLMSPFIVLFKVAGAYLIGLFGSISSVGLVALIPLIKVIAIIGLVVGAVVGLIYWLVGSEGLGQAWTTVTSAMSNFFSKAFGFLMNFSTNMKAIMDWLPNNWTILLNDMLRALGIFITNMVYNWLIWQKTLMRLFVMFQGWLLGKFTEIFSVGFLNTLFNALADAGEAIYQWALQAWEWIKSVFTGKDLNANTLTQQLRDAMKEGFITQDIFGSAKDIIKSGMSEMRGPLEGFKSNLKDLPNLVFDVNKPDGGGFWKKALEASKIPSFEEAKKQEEKVAAALPYDPMMKNQFKTMSLGKFSLAGTAVTAKKEEQQVHDSVVAEKMDKLIEVTKGKPVGAILT